MQGNRIEETGKRWADAGAEIWMAASLAAFFAIRLMDSNVLRALLARMRSH